MAIALGVVRTAAPNFLLTAWLSDAPRMLV